jgi:hypothetical protein
MFISLSNPSSARPKCEAVKIGEQSWRKPEMMKNRSADYTCFLLKATTQDRELKNK